MKAYKLVDLKLDMSAEFSVLITDDMLRQFSYLSGDNNPLHVDSNFAVATGFKDKVAHGLLTSSLYSRLVGMELPGKNALLHDIHVVFKAPVFVGDVVKVMGKIVYINEAFKQIEIKAKMLNQNDDIVSKTKIKVGLHE